MSRSNRADSTTSAEIPGSADLKAHARIEKLKKFLQEGKRANAILTCVAHPPVHAGLVAKTLYFEQFFSALTSFSSAQDMNEAIALMTSPHEIDVLMMAIYRAYNKMTVRNRDIIMLWHQRAAAAGGRGCIMRTATDDTLKQAWDMFFSVV